MPPDLLQTKLFVPPTRPGLVARTHLIDKLNQSLLPGCRLAVLIAPAGFGKTTLATQWIETLECSSGWLSLDENDNLPVRFFRYLIAAFQKGNPAIGNSAQELIEASRLDTQEIINSLSNELVASPHSTIIVLDDYHNIHEPAIHQALQNLFEALPPQVRMVLLSREDPPVPMARMRALHQIVEIRLDELRFTPEEAAFFLNRVMHLDLTVQQIRALEARTEGWIAGLQLAALSMQNIQDRVGFIQAFSGSHRFILDYLVEEVLDRQPEDIQTFLIFTSILERFNAVLCGAVLGETHRLTTNYQSLLDRIERSNLFLIPLDNEGGWFRYHHLFADLLRARLKSTHPEIVPDLHRRSSLWFEAHGDPKAALDHAMAAQDFDRAADLIDRHILARWRETDMDFFQVVNQIPPGVLHSRPSLCLHSAWMYIITGYIDRVPELVDAAERHLLPIAEARPQHLTSTARGLLSFAKVVRAYLDDFANRTPNLDISMDQAIETVPVENVGMRNSIAVVLGTIHYMEGDFQTAAGYFRDAIERDRLANGTNAIPVAVSRWARMLIIQGRLREALQLCQENEAYVRARGARRFYVAGNLNVLWGETLREWNQLAAAEKLIREGLRLHEGWPIPHAVLLGYTVLARLQIDQGNLQAATETAAQGLQLTHQYQIHPDFANAFQALLVRLWSAQGNTTELERWIRQNENLSSLPFDFRHEIRNICLARALLALGRAEEAVELLQQLADRAASGGRNGNLIEILILLATHSPTSQALPYLEKALRLAEPEGYLRAFLEAGPALRKNLKLAASTPAQLGNETRPNHQRLRSYVGAILEAYDNDLKPSGFEPQPAQSLPPVRDGQPVNYPLVEPLSAREKQVLQLVSQGLSNQQVADRLVISVRTVKKHLENVYGKLEVENRLQAVTRAREIHLL